MSKHYARIVLLGFISIMSAYIVYMHTTDVRGVPLERLIERHGEWMNGESEFANPWQYRIMSHVLLQGTIEVCEWIAPHSNVAIPYLLLHFVQMLVLFYCTVWYYRHLGIRNPFLLYAGLMLICYQVAASVFKSDFSFDTYFDIIFYLTAGALIIKQQYIWLPALTFVACLNRETCAFIPLMVLFPLSWPITAQNKMRWVASGVSMIAFLIAFLLPRFYFGYVPAVGINNMTHPMEYLTFNLTFLRLYPLLFGTLGIIPLVILVNIKKLKHPFLKNWFWLIVPLWFVIHFIKSNAMETRLFLVPQILIFVPAMLYLINNWYEVSRIKHSISTQPSGSRKADRKPIKNIRHQPERISEN